MAKPRNLSFLSFSMRLGMLVTAAVIMCTPVKCHERNEHPTRPNIVFFLVDDMGWNDVGFHGMSQIPTPNIDALAYNGIIINQYYTQPACSPSRSALLSGRYATSLGLQHIVIEDPQHVGLPLDVKTLPQHMKDLDYKTHMIGKWHLGFYRHEYLPERRGFDSFFGFWNGDTDHFYHVTVTNRTRDRLYGIPCYETRDVIPFSGLSSRDGRRKFNAPGRYLAELYTERAVRLINRHKGKRKPFFLYLAHHGVHRGNSFLPVRAPKPLTDLFTNINDPTRKNFAGALTAIDRSLGDIMEALDKNNMLNNTIIVFSADNGSPIPTVEQTNGGSNYPFRGVKVTTWEGGVRTNAQIWSNALRNKGTVYNGPMHISDWMPTLISAAGGRGNDVVRKYKLDGHDLWEAITNNLPSPRKNIVLQNDTIYNLKGYIKGDMKIVQAGNLPDFGINPNGYMGEDGRGPPPANFPKGSKTERVLRKLGDYIATEKPILIDCGSGPVTPCDPNKYCLYNITEDPCERKNLAEERPEVVKILEAELNQATEKDPPINYPMDDFASYPEFYEGFWAVWKDLNYNYNNTSC